MDLLIIFGAKYLIGVVALAAALVIAFSKDKRRTLTYTLAIALPLGYALARVAGMFYSHHQPFAEQGFEPLIPHAIDNTFPSDHTVVGGVFASLAFLADRRAGYALWALTLLVGLSRVLAGLHYGVDILAAAAIALVAVWSARLALRAD